MRRAAGSALAAGVLAVLVWALLDLPAPRGLSAEALEQLPRSGVSNPVTAALLNYRGYDTLLEMAVLLLAVVGMWSLRRGEVPAVDLSSRPLLMPLLRLVLPVLVVAGGYILWIGAFAPGGAFQGGALIGGGLVLAQLAGLGSSPLRRARLLRIGLVLGLAVFTLVAVGLGASTGTILGYPPGRAGTWIVIIESAATLSIGVTLGALFMGGRPDDGALPAEEGSRG